MPDFLGENVHVHTLNKTGDKEEFSDIGSQAKEIIMQ